MSKSVLPSLSCHVTNRLLDNPTTLNFGLRQWEWRLKWGNDTLSLENHNNTTSYRLLFLYSSGTSDLSIRVVKNHVSCNHELNKHFNHYVTTLTSIFKVSTIRIIFTITSLYYVLLPYSYTFRLSTSV